MEDLTELDVAKFLGSLAVIGASLLAAILLVIAAPRPAPAASLKGALYLSITSSIKGGQLHAVATLNGQIKHPETWLCPGIVWSCENQLGFRVAGETHLESPCNRTEVQRVFEWGGDRDGDHPLIVHESCRVRFGLEPVNGQRPLVAYGPEPLEWGIR
jgi:hypothetical protein